MAKRYRVTPTTASDNLLTALVERNPPCPINLRQNAERHPHH
jgi:hypothetical protein